MLIIFLHLEKSGGTTISTHVKKYFAKGDYVINTNIQDDYDLLITLTKEKKEKIKFIYGHKAFYGMDTKFKLLNASYFTLVRCPAERMVSYFNYLVAYHGVFIPFTTWYKNMSSQSLISFYSQNSLTYHVFKNIPFLERIFNKDWFFYLRAKKVLRKCFFVGLTNELSKDMELICEWIGVPSKYWRKRLVAKDMPANHVI